MNIAHFVSLIEYSFNDSYLIVKNTKNISRWLIDVYACFVFMRI